MGTPETDRRPAGRQPPAGRRARPNTRDRRPAARGGGRRARADSLPGMTAIPAAYACGGRPAACWPRSCPAPPSWLSPPEATPALCSAVEWQALDVLWPEGLTAGMAGCLSNYTVRVRPAATNPPLIPRPRRPSQRAGRRRQGHERGAKLSGRAPPSFAAWWCLYVWGPRRGRRKCGLRRCPEAGDD